MTHHPEVRLQELCHVNIGRTPSRGEARYWNGPNPWATIRDLADDVVTETREGITDEAVHSVMPAPALAGTILASFKLTIGRVAMAGQDLHHNEAIASLPVHRPDLVTPGYLRLVLPGAMAREQTNAAVMGAVLNKSKLLDLPIPLAPLEEQKRIVSLLDRAAEIRRRADSARAKARAIIPALFLDMFGHPPADWPMVSIDSLLAHQANAIRTGPFGSQLKHSEFIDSGVPVLGIDNVVENEFKWAKRRFLPPDKYNSFKRFRVFGGDVIVTIMGTTGRVCVTPDDLPECMSTKHLCAFTLNRSLVHPRYIWGTLLFDPAVRAHSRGKANGQIMEGWNMGIVKSICLPLPPLQLQSDFAEQAQRLETTAHALDAAAAKAEAMAAALSAEVFR